MGSLLSGMKPDKLVAAANTVNSPKYGALARRTAVLEVEGKVYAEFEDVPAGARIVRVLISPGVCVLAVSCRRAGHLPLRWLLGSRSLQGWGNHDGC